MMPGLDVEVPGKARAEQWAVEPITCHACRVRNVNVYPADLERIQCDCGHWLLTALGLRRARAAEARN